MNKVVLMGRLTADPEYRESGVCKYRLAVDRPKEGADFISCVCFGKTAEFARDYLKKGVKIAVEGRIQTGSYEGKNGTVYTTDVVVASHEFCERRVEGSASPSKPAKAVEQGKTRVEDESLATDRYFEEFEGVDEELPFK